MARAKERARLVGAEVNKQHALSIAWGVDAEPDLLWLLRVSVPFSYAASKNHLYSSREIGHVALRRERRAMQDRIADAIRQGLNGKKVAHNKVWLEILAQKPNHKGDAVNILDTVCDAVKAAVLVDDRWFCIRRLDWQIVKDNPRLFIGIGQDTDVDCQVCSYCGQIKPFTAFGTRKQGYLNLSRECKACRKAGRIRGRQS